MSSLRHGTGRTLLVAGLAILFLALSVPVVMAQSGPAVRIVPVVAPRRSPPPIPHTSVIPGGTVQEVGPASVAAQDAAVQQGTIGKPGVLQTESAISKGITLHDPGSVCNDFDGAGRWDGETWTDFYAGWGIYAADGGIYQAKNVTFDRERVVGPGANYASSEFSMKIASNQPYEAGVMSPPISVDEGDTVRVHVAYLIFNHDTEGRNWDYVSMGIIPRPDTMASYVQGHTRGQWDYLEQEIVAEGDSIVVMLQGHSPDAINSNIYFDNVQIFVNDRAVRNCRN